MRYFSYIDTAMRVIHINRNNDNTGGRAELVNERFRSFKGSSNFKSTIIIENIKFNLQTPEIQSLLIHESHHYWQSIHYPFLFYINFLEYHTLCLMRSQFEQFKDDHIALGSFKVDPLMRLNFTYCYDRFRYFWNKKNELGISIEGIVDDSKYDIDAFCLNDMIEESTMIFQYKILSPAPTAEDYFHHIQNPANKGYKKLYKFLARRFSPQYAYHFIPILVQLAFHTTEPKSMFMNLVNITIVYGFSEGIYSDMDYSLLKVILKEYVKPVQFSVSQEIAIEKMPVGTINADFYKEIINYAHSNKLSLHYPLSVHARKYLELLDTDKKVEEALIRASNITFKDILDRFYPYAFHFNFLDQQARNTALLQWSPDYDKKIEINDAEVTYDFLIKEQMNLQDVTLNLFFEIHKETPHQCDHKECPYYPMMLCSKWNSIPKTFESCQFPYWFPIHYHYKLSPTDHMLVRATDAEMEEFKTKYLHLRKKFGHDKFSYIHHDGNMTLQVSKKVIKENDYSFISDFIEKEFTGKPLVDFFGVLLIEFPDYEKDKRQVFEIPEIRSYMEQVFKLLPAFFYFLNLTSEFKQVSYMFPFFVDYELTTFPDGTYKVLLLEDSILKFSKQLSYVIASFAKQQGLDVEKTLKIFFEPIFNQNDHNKI